MSNNTAVPLLNSTFCDEMTDLIRAHTQTAMRQAVQAELEVFLRQHVDTDDKGQPERGPQLSNNLIQTSRIEQTHTTPHFDDLSTRLGRSATIQPCVRISYTQ